jgi:hypothetical protein
VFVNNVHLLLRVVAVIWQNSAPTSDDLNTLGELIQAWKSHFVTHNLGTSKSKCQFDNFHRIAHAPEQAFRDGGFSVTCTSSYEMSHTRFAKQPAFRHNRKGQVEHRMLSVLRNTDQLTALLDDLVSPGVKSPRVDESIASSASGSVMRTRSNADGQHLTLTHYFRVKQLEFPPCAQHVLLPEVNRAIAAERIVGNVPLEDIVFWQFLRLRTVGDSNEIVIRSPAGGNITCINCGDNSYAQVLAIMDIVNVTLLAIRWFTPTFPGSAGPCPRSRAVRSLYTMVKLTNKVVVIPVDHIQGTVHIVPSFSNNDDSEGILFFINTVPLGSKLRAKPWEMLLSIAESDDAVN